MGKRKSKGKGTKPKKGKKSKAEWSESELDVLRSYEEKWFLLSSPEDQNTLAYGEIAENLRRLSPEKYGVQVILQKRELHAEWDKKCSQIKSWYKRNRPAAKERRIFKFERRIALRTVVAHTKSAAIKAAVLEKLPDNKKEDQREYFKNFQTTVTEFMHQLSKKERKQYEAIRDEWQAEGPPADVQARNAQRFGYRCVEDMHKVANKQFGMLMITFTARPTRSGGWEYFIHDYNPNLNIPNNPILSMLGWAKPECRAFGKMFAKWVGYTDEAKAGHLSEDNGQSAGTNPGTTFALQTTNSGLPILPDPVLSSSGTEYFGTKREIIREFFVQHYRLATGKSTSRVPWGAMNESVREFIKSEFIPKKVLINDPGRMSSNHVSILLEHLRDRQKVEGIPTFLFHQFRQQDNSFAAVKYPTETLEDNEKSFENQAESVEPFLLIKYWAAILPK
ncbi:hypothetical protein CPB83DRAFT_900931 [Crepidotus variabilis]|uniref:Uncharacterized protein n=1 Tax=Crepidotus variabilis TaxID=179855 RepID=A0A9P6E0Z5_9AGAR|nr:hypothetical protein CPB83DRAFT_900931 [Crepidotus variabilis]